MGVVAQVVAPGDHLVFKDIGHGHKLDVIVPHKAVNHGAAAASTAADESNPERIAVILGNA